MADEEERDDVGIPPEEAEDGEESPVKTKSSTLLFLAIGILIVIVTPLVTYLVVRKTVQKPFAAAPADDNEVLKESTQTHSLKPIYVNIAGTQGTRVLKIEPVLVVSEGRLIEHLSKLEPLLRDKVLEIVSPKTIDELETFDTRRGLKNDIMESVNELTRGELSGAVIDVCFNEYLIQ